MTAHHAIRTEEVTTLRKLFSGDTAFDEEERAERWASIIARPFAAPRPLMDYHDLMLFVLAYPRSPADHALAASELERVGLHAGIMASRNEAHNHALSNSGIAGTTTRANFSIDLTRWLTGSGMEAVKLDSFGGEEDLVRNVLLAFATASERESMDDARYDAFQRVADASGGDALGWLVRAMDASTSDPAVRHALWEACRPKISLNAAGSWTSRTYCRGSSGPIHCFKNGYREPVDVSAVLSTPLAKPDHLSEDHRGRLLAAMRGILVGYQREIDPVTFGDAKSIEYHTMGSGLCVALMHLPPGRRTAFDSYVGYIAFSNGIPVAYGGAWIFPGKSKVGVNVLPAFRGGPSMRVFAQILRCYTQRFRVECFEAENYQLGHGNSEGIRSGTYWFYYRMGFRTADPELAPLELAEQEHMRRDRAYRTPPTVLRRLASQSMLLKISAEKTPIFELMDLSEAVFRSLAKIEKGDRRKAVKVSVQRTARVLGVTDMRSWPDPERRGFEDLSPAIAGIPDLEEWSKKDKKKLIALLRAKGHVTEGRYIGLLREHHQLLEAWARMAAAVG